MISRFLQVWIFFAAVAAVCTYDDLIVAVGDQIELLSNGSQSRMLVFDSFNASVLVALAHDPSSRKLFFSDRRNRRGHVFSVDFDGVKAEGLIRDVVERNTNESVEGLTYDHIEKTLFWTDGTKQSIRRITVDRDNFHANENASIELVHLLKGDKPRGLVSDPCTRMLYWTNWNIERPTIERSYFNGSYREVIVQSGLFMPHGLGIDIDRQMIYWANNLRHGTFQIEKSHVDGLGRQVIYEGKGHEMRGQFIFGLTVGEHDVYWTDWDQKTLWSLPKEGSLDGPRALRRYQHKPMAVIVLQHQPINCLMIATTMEHITESSIDTRHSMEPTLEIFQDITIPQVLHNSTSENIDWELCEGYCFNDGHCFVVNSEMSCSCPQNYRGDRCELLVEPETNQNVSESCGSSVVSFASAATNSTVFTALITLSTMCVMLINIVAYLSFRVWRLSSAKPRFRRRIIRQDKHYRPAERVINIEDCCNMNICETPCTEPPSGASLPGQSSDRVKLLNCQF